MCTSGFTRWLLGEVFNDCSRCLDICTVEGSCDVDTKSPLFDRHEQVHRHEQVRGAFVSEVVSHGR